ncbi:hypothetical protein DEFR109230_19715 [Deinococcus frigens]
MLDTAQVHPLRHRVRPRMAQRDKRGLTLAGVPLGVLSIERRGVSHGGQPLVVGGESVRIRKFFKRLYPA